MPTPPATNTGSFAAVDVDVGNLKASLPSKPMTEMSSGETGLWRQRNLVTGP